MEPPVPPAAGVGGCEAVAGPLLPGGAGGRARGDRKGRGEEVPMRLRLGRARRRAEPGTPAPSWKMEDEEEAASLAAAARRSSASASVRQRGASLWEIHDAAPEAQLRRRGGRELASAGREGAGRVGESDQKATITERLNSEIQAFLLSKRSGSSKHNEKYINDNTTLRRQSLEFHLNGATSAPQLAEDDDDDSVASDLHCFELNMHGNGIWSHDHIEPRRCCRGGLDVPKRRSADIQGITSEGSHLSCVPICSHKDSARSCSSNLQHATKMLGIDSHCNAGVTIAEEQNGGITSTHISRRSQNDSSKNNPEAPHVTCLGQESFDHYSRTSLFSEGTTSGDLANRSSPTQQLTYQSTSLTLRYQNSLRSCQWVWCGTH